MPQLNPAPWFMILTSAWLVLLVFILPKILGYLKIKSPTIKSPFKSKSQIWSWPWP